MTLIVTAVDRNYQPRSPTAEAASAGLPAVPPPPTIPPFIIPPRAGFHILRVEVTFKVVDKGQHEVAPGGAVTLIDAVGQVHFANPFLSAATCTPSDGGVYGAGSTLGPTALCFEAGGPANGTLTLDWSGVRLTLP